jgi:hypothetical protein
MELVTFRAFGVFEKKYSNYFKFWVAFYTEHTV